VFKDKLNFFIQIREEGFNFPVYMLGMILENTKEYTYLISIKKGGYFSLFVTTLLWETYALTLA
jgi:hypothetical protein